MLYLNADIVALTFALEVGNDTEVANNSTSVTPYDIYCSAILIYVISFSPFTFIVLYYNASPPSLDLNVNEGIVNDNNLIRNLTVRYLAGCKGPSGNVGC